MIRSLHPIVDLIVIPAAAEMPCLARPDDMAAMLDIVYIDDKPPGSAMADNAFIRKTRRLHRHLAAADRNRLFPVEEKLQHREGT